MKSITFLLVILISLPGIAKKRRSHKKTTTSKTNLSDPLSVGSYKSIGQSISDMDSIIYLRKDFNDYHRADRKKRPSYLPPIKK